MNKPAISSKMLELAQDVIFVIFSHMSIKEVIRLKRVSRAVLTYVVEYQQTYSEQTMLNDNCDDCYIDRVKFEFPNIKLGINRHIKWQPNNINKHISLPDNYKSLHTLCLGEIYLITPISDLHQLRRLALNNVEGDICLAKLVNLERFTIYNYCTNVSIASQPDLLNDTVLKQLSRLKELRLSSTRCTGDLTLLKGLVHLRLNNVKNESDLSKLTQLDYLELANSNNNSDISRLTNLKSLILNSSINNSNLSQLTNLESLHIKGGNNTSNINKLTKLRYLALICAKVEVHLPNLTNLVDLTLIDVDINTDLGVLTKLVGLYLYNCEYRYNLADMPRLRELTLSNVVYKHCLSSLSNLRRLHLIDMSYIYDLSKIHTLRDLYINASVISAGLTDLWRLDTLELSKLDTIADLSALPITTKLTMRDCPNISLAARVVDI